MKVITVTKRVASDKPKHLRNAGIMPCVIYGGELTESAPVQMEARDAIKLLEQCRKGSRIDIQLEDRIIPAQIKDVERDTVTAAITHIGFQALKADQKVNSVVHVILKNVDKVTGSLERMQLEIAYSAFPTDMIDTIAFDLDGLPIGTVITVGDIEELKNAKIELLADSDSIVFRIIEKKILTAERNAG
ncbi:MAG: 50S ribosomal protein L25/general stress protein Ctc [Angelakisella sp.]